MSAAQSSTIGTTRMPIVNLKNRRWLPIAAWLLLFANASSSAIADGGKEAFQELESRYSSDVLPLLKRYCFKCHADDRTEAEIDLAAFPTLASVRQHPDIWEKIDGMLDSVQMPPKKSRQPTDEERSRLATWVHDYLAAEARSLAGDPGRVVLRRLSNSEYDYTIQDLTGLSDLEPTREFPVDGAAGEGFTNTGDALVMSPSLVTKYLDAAKRIASHAVFLPDGMVFSEKQTRRDLSDEWIAKLQAFYRNAVRNGSEEKTAGKLPLDRYLRATLAEQEALVRGKRSFAEVSTEYNLNPRYLEALWKVLTGDPELSPSILLNSLRRAWRTASPEDATSLVESIESWRKTLWKFNAIGHIGRSGGPESWLEAVDPVSSNQEFRVELPKPDAAASAGDITIHLITSAAGDGSEGDYVVWRQPRLEGLGLPPLLLRDVRGVHQALLARRRAALAKTTQYLAAVSTALELEVQRKNNETKPPLDVDALAGRYKVDPPVLERWLKLLAITGSTAVIVEGHFTETMKQAGGYDFVRGWGSPATPSILANHSDREVRIPGIARPGAVVAHPSPTLYAAAGWQSPIDGVVRVTGHLRGAHPECGNGVEWIVEHRSGDDQSVLWQGEHGPAGEATMPETSVSVRRGELIAFIIGPRDGSHACDLTECNLVIHEAAGEERVWDLAKDTAPRFLDANPLPDTYGHPGVWHFYRGELASLKTRRVPASRVPAGSLLDAWLKESDVTKKEELAKDIQAFAAGDPPADRKSPDGILHLQLQAVAGTLDAELFDSASERDPRFGVHPYDRAPSGTVPPADLVVRAPSVTTFRLPSELARGRQLVVTAELEPRYGDDGSVQVRVSTADRQEASGELEAGQPILLQPKGRAEARFLRSFTEFRDLFPAAACYYRIVPVDEVVTLTLYHREDEPLRRLLLSELERAKLEKLWDELYFISHEPLQKIVALEQIREFATQDRPDLVVAFRAVEKPTAVRAEAFRRRLVRCESVHVDAIVELANRAWRRPLTDTEQQGVRHLYAQLRATDLEHDAAARLTLARVLVAPEFLYRIERAAADSAAGERARPVSELELATRLSYFLWSSLPDEELRDKAETGTLSESEILRGQVRRMLQDPRVRRLAVQFACQWLHIRDFDATSEKNEKLYPAFAQLRGSMYEESVRFFEDLFQNDGSVLGILTADHTFLNQDLAAHYGIEHGNDGDRGGDHNSKREWRRIEGVRSQGRGGILAMATVLASQSGASRTSPILRGNWISETLLGERLPRPPPNVPQLPESVPQGLTARELIEQHSSVPECAKCHARIDPYGFALEQYDAIGRLRPQPVNTKTTLLNGPTIDGIEGLRRYLAEDRRRDFLEQFCRKLLGYALGRSVALSDRPLLEELVATLDANDYRIHDAIEAVVLSPQFLQKRTAAAD